MRQNKTNKQVNETKKNQTHMQRKMKQDKPPGKLDKMRQNTQIKKAGQKNS